MGRIRVRYSELQFGSILGFGFFSGPQVWALSFFKGLSTMGPHFEGGLSLCLMGL